MEDHSVPTVTRTELGVSKYYLQFLSQNLLMRPLTYVSMALFTDKGNDTGIVGFYEGDPIPPPSFDDQRKNIYIRLNTSAAAMVIDLINGPSGVSIYRTGHDNGPNLDTGLLIGKRNNPVGIPGDGRPASDPEFGKFYEVPPQFTICRDSVEWSTEEDPDNAGVKIPVLSFNSCNKNLTATVFFHRRPFVGVPSFNGESDASRGHFELHFPISVAHSIRRTFDIAKYEPKIALRCLAKSQLVNERPVWVTGIDTPKYVDTPRKLPEPD